MSGLKILIQEAGSKTIHKFKDIDRIIIFKDHKAILELIEPVTHDSNRRKDGGENSN